jgi:hypothetical protein
MKKFFTTLVLVSVLLISSCAHKYYTNSNFDSLTANHKNIAILPVELKLMGNKPAKMSDSDVKKQEAAESKAFQQSLFNKILAYGNDKNYETKVNVISLEKINAALSKNGINYENIASKDDAELCKLLQVDAVVRLSIEKTRYMSDLAGMGSEILNDVLRNKVGIFLPGTTVGVPNASEKTNDIKTVCTIQANGTTLWNNNYEEAANWQNTANQIIESITVHYAKTFPYRKKRIK